MNETAEQAGQLALPWLAPKDAARPDRLRLARPLIRELPAGDQPRARLQKHGAGVPRRPNCSPWCSTYPTAWRWQRRCWPASAACSA